MTDKQPEALRLADNFEIYAADHEPDGWPAVKQKHLTAAAVELRRLHEVNQELLEALKAIRNSGYMPQALIEHIDAITTKSGKQT